MADGRQQRVFTLVQRELREHRSSLCWTPFAIAAGLTVVMLLSVLLAKHISALGDAVTELIPPENTSTSTRAMIAMPPITAPPTPNSGSF